MTKRTRTKTVTFGSSFVLGELDEVMPAGAYAIETDEELLEGISFPAYRRVSTLIHLHPERGQPGLTRTLVVYPKELDAAFQRDQATAKMPADTDSGQRTPDSVAGLRRKEVDRQAIDRAEDEGMILHPR